MSGDDRGDGVPTPLGVAAGLTLVAWAVTALVAITTWFGYSDARSARGVSTAEGTQLANEYLADLAPWAIVSFGVTAVAVLLGLTYVVQYSTAG